MLSRRALLVGSVVGVLLPGSAHSQTEPKLFVLPKGVTSPQLHLTPGGFKPRFEMSLEGWLVANGAAVPCATYRELCDYLAGWAHQGDSASACRLPAFLTQYDASGQPISGIAVCPFSRAGMPPGELKPFDIKSNL